MERPIYNGTYCATAYWSKQYGFHVEYWKQQNDLLNIPKGVARICYKDSIYENGWAQIEIETQRTYPDWVQAFGAGIIEGALTWNQVYNQWFNTIQSSCDQDDESQNFCTWLRDLITSNFVKIKEKAAINSPNDHYWHQVNLYFEQLQGLEIGYRQGAKRARSSLEEEISFADFLLMNCAADIEELKIYYENYVVELSSQKNITQEEKNGRNFLLPSATMISTILNQPDANGDGYTWQLLFGHSTAGSYASMLRIHKRYKFHYHFTANQKSNTVPGFDITFTGYPGILASTDDFYIIRGRQLHAIVAGVAIKNANLQLYLNIDVKEIIPLAARVMAANRIAQNRRTWSKAMSRQPFTGSKQWLIVDLNKLNAIEKSFDKNEMLKAQFVKDATTLPKTFHNQIIKDLIWIIEQLPGRMHAKDVTNLFIEGKQNAVTWLTNGVPYFEEILNASNISADNSYTHLIKANGDNNSKNNLNNLEDIDKYLRTHAYRGDLAASDTDTARQYYGNIDIKLFAYNVRFGMSDYHAIAGPIFMHVQQHNQPAKQHVQGNEAENSDSQNRPSSMRDDRLSVQIDYDKTELAELEIISADRPVRNDMLAIALQQRTKMKPFKWQSSSSSSSSSLLSSSVSQNMPIGHPHEWNFNKVSPNWAW